MMDFADLFRSARPLLDVRAPVEFDKGAFPTATSMPILDDEQREKVGTCYKEHGSTAAEALGYQLVGPMQDQRVEAWQHYLQANPDALLYCFRGGKRSEITQQWLKNTGVDIERVPGGYKALRQYLLSVFERLPPITIISGKTGVGKTDLLKRFTNAVDLEGLANHRGSAFGRTRTMQPTQINFENSLAIKILNQSGSIALEDESRLIGRINLPTLLQEAMQSAPILLLEDTIHNRVRRILNEYVVDQLAEMSSAGALLQLETEFLSSLEAIQKRLGGDRYQQTRLLMVAGFAGHRQGDSGAHEPWIETLLTQYYDPMYEYQLSKKQGRVKLRVDWQHLPNETLLDLGPDAGKHL
ncbi:MAG: tRNA 2-selenouridine synthase [Candidatus Azotimanducaceae bacterium]|jgi:tRNA 2-selenouridine synthase